MLDPDHQVSLRSPSYSQVRWAKLLLTGRPTVFLLTQFEGRGILKLQKPLIGKSSVYHKLFPGASEKPKYWRMSWTCIEPVFLQGKQCHRADLLVGFFFPRAAHQKGNQSSHLGKAASWMGEKVWPFHKQGGPKPGQNNQRG